MDRTEQISYSHEGVCGTQDYYNEYWGSWQDCQVGQQIESAVSKTNLNAVNFHRIVSETPDSRTRNLSERKVNWDRQIDKIVSRQFFAFVISSSSCLTRYSKSEESVPEVDRVGGPQ